MLSFVDRWRWPIVMMLLAWPGALIRLGVFDTSIPVRTVLFGLAIVGAAFILTWIAEAAERDIPRTLALLGLALIAVLPEYAVDVLFAWKAGHDPSYAAYATANMTGGNRLLVGVGWSMVVGIFWWRTRGSVLRLDPTHRVEVGLLAIATIYSFVIPIRGGITLLDSAFLIGLFLAYVVMASRGELEEESVLVGPSLRIANLPTWQRRAAVVALFLYAGLAILMAAEPFADGLIETGVQFGIDEFTLVQWLAPLASEFPEFLVAGLLAWRLRADAALGALVSSKVNQWTLLIGCLPIAYAISSGTFNPLPTDTRQVEEMLLTAAQSLLAVILLINLRMSLVEALALLVLFLAQFFTPHTVIPRNAFSVMYLVLAAVFLVRQLFEMRPFFGRPLREYAHSASDDDHG
ncbi:MAG TPA: sodium:calcium antiporter [Dehalococcoidia bacterium]|jgi:cation:H+ antiporter|nr:sodium:calcium antiporter [Dehalococcoidia bacterium]